MAGAALRVVQYSELERWDVKYFTGRIKSKYPLVLLADFVTEHNEKVRPFESPDETFKILGVNNIDGIFHAYDSLGKEIKQPYKKVCAGDFAYNPYRINIGSIGMVPLEHDGAYISPAYVVFSVNSSAILPEVFWFILRSNFFNQSLRAATAGSVRMNLFISFELLALKIPIPPLPIQQKIVAYWEAAQSRTNDDLCQANDTEKSIPSLLIKALGLKNLGVAHGKRAFVLQWQKIDRWGVGVAREISRRPTLSDSPYPIVSLSEVIDDLQNGWSPKCLTRPAEDDEWGVLKVGAVSFGWFDERQNKALPPSLKPREQYEVKQGDFIISRANITQYVGACALVGKVRTKLMLCDKLFRVVWKENSMILPQFLDEVLKTPHLRWQIENSLTGASPTMKNISKPALMALRFPLPPLEAQKEIISELMAKRNEVRLLKISAKDHHQSSAKKIEKMILGTLPVEVN